ncbi:MAG: hypothetical protein ACYDCN_08970 [Bacteroidia bacterium]
MIKAIRKSKTDGDPLAGGDPITDTVLNASADALQTVYLFACWVNTKEQEGPLTALHTVVIPS